MMQIDQSQKHARCGARRDGDEEERRVNFLLGQSRQARCRVRGDGDEEVRRVNFLKYDLEGGRCGGED